jgi:hypothetical protein
MSPTRRSALPAVRDDPVRDVEGAIERAIAVVPAARTHAVSDPAAAADAIARRAARQAALLSGSLALPPGPLGMLTVLPDLFLIWKTQRQMVADIFGVYGRTAELTRVHMLYCLFRHAASQVLRDVVVRTGQRVIAQQVSSGAMRTIINRVGVGVTRRVAGTAATRWVPLVGAAAVGAYAFWDTMQVARTAHKLLADLPPMSRQDP